MYYLRAAVGGKVRWVSLRTTKLAIAEARLRDELAGLETAAQAQAQGPGPGHGGSGTVAFPQPRSVGELVRLWEARATAARDAAAATRESAHYHARRLRETWARTMGGPLDLVAPDQLTRKQVETWLEGMQTGARITRTGERVPYSARATAGALQALQGALAIGRELGVCRHDPTEGMARPQAPAKRPELPEAEAVGRVATALWRRAEGEEPLRALPALMALLMLYTGLRKGEAAGLRWDDVEIARGTIRVRGTKTAAAVRVAPLGPDARRVLDQVRIQMERAEAALRASPTGALGPDRALVFGGMQDCRKTLTSASAAAGIPRLRPHDLRKLFITSCCEAAIDPVTVAQWVGHRDLKLILQVYAALREAHSREAIGRVRFS